jgi:uncharacterized membrane protein YdfJ with MMPL/SSD domain
VLVLTYLLLMRAFRSLILPLKAVILNLLSVAAAYGALVVVFRFGLGKDVLGLYQFPRGILRLPGRRHRRSAGIRRRARGRNPA